MDVKETLKYYFGFDSFNPGQEEIINSILSGRDVLAVMPTGSGKSICYQVPALLLPGITIVISPLISLMQDQVKSLNEAGIHAGYINSSLTEAQISKVYSRTIEGGFKILYVAPERLESYEFLDFASKVDISMVTVDEAHCISTWGQDFRPSYLKIVSFIDGLSKRPIISGFTATATEEVKTDISCALKLNDPKIVVTGFDRENLYYNVEVIKDKDNYILEYVKKHPNESGIIYCATRKNVDMLYDLLNGSGCPVTKYHAGLNNEERKKNQNDFIYDRLPVMVATNAFGMGINKTNVRYVIHYNMPQSMENYYQEAGRAGRDGESANCILLFSPKDVIINEFLLDKRDFTDVSEDDIKLIRERDIRRLHVMEGYCRTDECLRNYILEYFGEKRTEPCCNCGNCQREYTEIDVTNEAKKIINCVYEANGRYGINVITGTLIGANRKKLEKLGTTNYRSYAALKDSTEETLKQVIIKMIQDGYLYQTDDRFSLIKLGDITPLKAENSHIFIRKYKGREIETRIRKTRRSTDLLTKAGYDLFEILRLLRLELAKEEGMPPYIIFSDKTLIDMSIKVPNDKASMLNVSGVGESKYNKYGERFIEKINQFMKDNPNAVTSEKGNGTEVDVKKVRREKDKKKKGEFYLNPEDGEKFEYKDYYNVSELRDELNRISTATDVKRVFATDIIRYLTKKGYIEERQVNGYFVKVPTEIGEEKGIISMEKVSEAGTVYSVLGYPKLIQKEIIDLFIDAKNHLQ